MPWVGVDWFYMVLHGTTTTAVVPWWLLLLLLLCVLHRVIASFAPWQVVTRKGQQPAHCLWLLPVQLSSSSSPCATHTPHPHPPCPHHPACTRGPSRAEHVGTRLLHTHKHLPGQPAKGLKPPPSPNHRSTLPTSPAHTHTRTPRSGSQQTMPTTIPCCVVINTVK